MMQVKIYVTDGPNAGSEAWIRAGQVLEIGRSQRCGLVMTDMRMSSVHFSVEFRGEDCKVQDLGSRNGIFVNGHKVSVATIVPGDSIKAGESQFSIELTPGNGKPSEQSVAPKMPEPIETVEMPVITEFQTKACASGLTRFEPTERQKRPPLAFVRALAKATPLYVVANPTRLDLTVESIGSAQYLFDWLPEDAKKGFSPLVFPAQKSPFKDADGIKTIEAGWGKDAVFVIASRREPGKILKHLRELARGKDHPEIEPPPGTASGFYFPRVLEQLLTVSPPETASFLMTEFDAVLLEAPRGTGWAVIARENFEETLLACGLVKLECNET